MEDAIIVGLVIAAAIGLFLLIKRNRKANPGTVVPNPGQSGGGIRIPTGNERPD